MAELTTQERLQPSLLDRLTDRARFRERVELLVSSGALAGAGMNLTDFNRLMEAHEFSLKEQRESDVGRVEVRESAAGGISVRQLLDHRFRPHRDGAEIAVRDLVTVQQRQLIPNTSESRRDRVISAAQLKDSVMRDLGWLLNTGNLASVVDLSAYERVAASVLNYGIPELAGSTVSSADLEAVAAAIRHAIETYEPRLDQVRVVPRTAEEGGVRANTLSFVIEAELWGQPTPQHLFLHTELDLESAAASVRDAGGGG